MVTRTRWVYLVAAALVLPIVDRARLRCHPRGAEQVRQRLDPLLAAPRVARHINHSTIGVATAQRRTSLLRLLGPSLDCRWSTRRTTAGLPAFLTVFSSRHERLARPTARTAHGRTPIVNQVVAGNYDGIDVDYEFVWSVTRAEWPAITPQLGRVRRPRGQGAPRPAASCSPSRCHPVWNSGTSGYTVYAQPPIAPAVDRLRLMVYDWSITQPRPHRAELLGEPVIAYSTTSPGATEEAAARCAGIRSPLVDEEEHRGRCLPRRRAQAGRQHHDEGDRRRWQPARTTPSSSAHRRASMHVRVDRDGQRARRSCRRRTCRPPSSSSAPIDTAATRSAC